MSKLGRSIAILLVFAIAAAAQTPLQDWNSVKIMTTGAEVRIKTASHTVRGQIRSVTDEALTVYSGNGQQMFMRQEVLRVGLKKKGHRGRNTLIGLGVGAAIGVIVGVADHKDCTGFCIFSTTRGQDAGIGAAGFGLLGTIVGALLPTGGWYEVYRK